MDRPTSIITDATALADAISHWRTQPALAVDTESNSFYVYRERTCLVQVSTREADWIIDPLAVDLAPFGEVLVDAGIQKVLHAAEFDVLSLRRDYGFVINNLYDTLVASKALGRRKVGLASLVEELLGVNLAKDEQRSDWGRRPLTPQQIEYAFADTRHLLPLADLLKGEVAARGSDLLEEVAIDCAKVALKQPRPREFDPEGFERHALARSLDGVGRQVLRALYLMREQKAQETNRPLFRVLGDEAMGLIAKRRPTSRAELVKLPGVTPKVADRLGPAVLEAVQQAIEAGPLPPRKRTFTPPDPNEEARFEALRVWRKSAADARQVDVEVIGGNALLKAIAKANPKGDADLEPISELDEFRRARYGQAILDVLRRTPTIA